MSTPDADELVKQAVLEQLKKSDPAFKAYRDKLRLEKAAPRLLAAAKNLLRYEFIRNITGGAYDLLEAEVKAAESEE
jgi:predicted DNA-binding protein YlxM (UPF0122 family)